MDSPRASHNPTHRDTTAMNGAPKFSPLHKHGCPIHDSPIVMGGIHYLQSQLFRRVPHSQNMGAPFMTALSS